MNRTWLFTKMFPANALGAELPEIYQHIQGRLAKYTWSSPLAEAKAVG